MKSKYKFGDKQKKHSNIKNTKNEESYVIPDILPMSIHDICNYVARYRMANFQIQAVLKIDGNIDYNKLIKAIRLSVDDQPVLGCHFIESDPPYWKRIKTIDDTTFCSFEETDNIDEAIIRFTESPLDMDKDPMIKLKLLRCGSYDTLCLKINHTCCDGAGAKEYIDLLSQIYSTIDNDNNTYIPIPKIAGRKDQDKLYGALDLNNPKAMDPSSDTPRSIWPFKWDKGLGDSTGFVLCRLPQDSLENLSSYAKSKGATINDLVITAFYRAMFKYTNAPYGIPLDMGCTIDLRRYLPNQKAEGIRNFSGGFITRIERTMHEPFEKTLVKVVHATNKIKNRQPGLHKAILGEVLESVSFSYIKSLFKTTSKVSKVASKLNLNNSFCTPGLSNLGILSKSLFKFGEKTVIDAYILPPVVRKPTILLLAETYNGIMMLSLGFYKSEIGSNEVETILNKIKDELIEGCK